MPSISAKLLAVHEEQERNRKLCGKSYNKAESQYIYTDALGNRIKPNYLTSAFPGFLVKNGFQRMRFHDLRHSCASLLLANGVSLKEIQEWLGHSDFAITANIYAHLEFGSKVASAGKMVWIEATSLVSLAKTETDDNSSGDDGSIQALPDFITTLISGGVSPESVQKWLSQVDYSSVSSFANSFHVFQANATI